MDMHTLLVALVSALIASSLLPLSAAAGSRPCGRILFLSSDGRNDVDLDSVRGDGSGQRTIRDLSHSARMFLSPDASLIASTRYRGGPEDNDVWLMNSDGTGYKNLTQTKNQDEYVYDWSPGSRRVAIERLDRQGTYVIYLLNVLTGKETRVVEGQRPSFSPDGTKVAYAAPSPDVLDSTNDIFTIDLDGGNVTRITHDGSSDDDYPDWSPAGEWMSFSRIPRGQMNENEGPYADIWRVRTNGEDEENLTRWQDDYNGVSTAAWSPDGRHIAYNTDNDGGGSVYIMRSDGTHRSEPLSEPVEHYSRGATWSPSGNHVAYERSGSSSTEIWSYDVEAGARRKLTSTPRRYEYGAIWASCRT